MTQFKFDLDFIGIIIQTKFHVLWIKTVPSRVYTRFIYNFTLAPNFKPNMTQFGVWSRFSSLCLNQTCAFRRLHVFSMIWPRDLIFHPTWPSFKLDLDFIGTNILTKFHELWIKTVPSRVYTRFSTIWPGNLVFDPTWPSLELDLDFIVTDILTKFHELWINIVPSRVYTRLF